MRAFYSDYIVCFSDSSIGIYDTKAGITAEIEETKAKSDALQGYIKKQAQVRKIHGGIIQTTQAGMYLFEGNNYVSTVSSVGWKRLEI